MITCIDLFCGCGGMTKGLVKSGIKVLAGIDYWDKAIDSYKSNFDHISICADLTTYSPENFQNDNEISSVDLIVGGPPCQGFSMAGKRDNKDPRNSLFMEFHKYITHYKPKMFLMENVMGILSMRLENGDKAIDIIMDTLSENYNCHINKLYASDFGVPQKRRRVIIVGIRKDLNIEPTDIVKPRLDMISIRNILENREDVDPKLFLSQRAIDGIRRRKANMKQKGFGFGAQYVDLDKPCYTISARYWKDGYDALVKYDDEHIRRLSVTELKRIQTFGDDFVLIGSKKDRITQIGNAVASEFAYHLGLYVQSILNF